VKITLSEALAILACREGVQVWGADMLRELDAVAARQPTHDPLVERGEGHYARATAEGLRQAGEVVKEHYNQKRLSAVV
jgi:hypothetical protein